VVPLLSGCGVEVTLDAVDIRDEEVDDIIEVIGGVELVLDHIGKDRVVKHFGIEEVE
jgi:hypothetical protein